jgi:hypothetical protein
MSRGIDYSGPKGTCNRDIESGIRFGIINQNDVSGWLYDELEAVYDQYCPNCGNELDEDWEDTAIDIYEADGDNEHEWIADDTLPCPHCSKPIHDSEQYADEPNAQILDTDDIKGFLDDFGLWITKSPYYTKTAFCSPCCPGAGDLNSPRKDGVKTFCLDHSWFEDKKAPYPVYRVDTDELVEKES